MGGLAPSLQISDIHSVVLQIPISRERSKVHALLTKKYIGILWFLSRLSKDFGNRSVLLCT